MLKGAATSYESSEVPFNSPRPTPSGANLVYTWKSPPSGRFTGIVK